MTNIVAAVTVAIVTNVSESFPMRQVSVACPGAFDENTGFTYAIACLETVPVQNPKEKYITTTIKEVHTLRFKWNGAREVVSERVIASQTATQKLEWVQR